MNSETVNLLFFISAMVIIGMGLIAHRKCLSSFGTQPPPETGIGIAFSLFGILAVLASFAFPIAGFFTYDWWIPVTVYFGSALVAGLVRGMLGLYRIDFLMVMLAIPLGIGLGVYWVFAVGLFD